jgi:hypothetical protein
MTRRAQRDSAAQGTKRKIYTPFNDTEIEAIDRFGFDRRIRERSATIRELVKIGLLEKRAGEARRQV